MPKHKDEIRDIYQSGTHDFEKDFTPQVARDLLESRRRDLRRSRIVSLLSGALVVLLSVVLVTVVIRDFLSERNPTRNIRAQEMAYIPRYSLSADSAWVMDYQLAAAQADASEPPGPKPLSTRWVKNAAYHIIMGQQALSINEFDSALEHFRKVAEIYPAIEGLHRTLGMLYLQRGEVAQAAVHLENALREEETFDVAVNLGSAYMGAQEYDKAETWLKRALVMQPQNPICHKNLAILYRQMKRDSDAVYHFEKYLDLRPGDLETLQTYALYLTSLGRWREAADFLTVLTQEVKEVAPVYFLLAQVQVQNGQPEKALAALKRGVQLIDPQLALAWMSRDEFNAVRGTGEFKTLINQLEIATVTLDSSR